MKIVLQRVKKASVWVDDEQISSIQKGLLLLVGIHTDDSIEQMSWLTNKILKLRIFDDDQGKMNLSVADVKGEILVVPQFTLLADYEKGNRPSYFKAARPDKAKKLYQKMIAHFKKSSNLNVASGKFGANMDVRLCNDGPVTLVMDR